MSSGQINLVLPVETPGGMVTLVANGPATLTGALLVVNVSPALFGMHANGTGVAAATAVRMAIGNAGSQIPVAVFACRTVCTGVPIMVGRGARSGQFLVAGEPSGAG